MSCALELPDGETEVLNIPRLVPNKSKPKSKRLVRDPEHAALIHLITPGGDVLWAGHELRWQNM